VLTGFFEDSGGKEITWKNLGVDGRTKLKLVLEKGYGKVDWIYLAQDEDK
jgi:hypothetical protein